MVTVRGYQRWRSKQAGKPTRSENLNRSPYENQVVVRIVLAVTWLTKTATSLV
jgi:hypothetical protein